jgi:hypothetical protein
MSPKDEILFRCDFTVFLRQLQLAFSMHWLASFFRRLDFVGG